MTDLHRIIVEAAESGDRLDHLIAGRIDGLSRSAAQALIHDGYVLINGAPTKPAIRPVTGDEIEVTVLRGPSFAALPEEIPLDIVYQDSDLAVINKPAGLVVHPAPGHSGGTLANALAACFPQARFVGAAERPGIVHRLDKDTSGLLVVALNPDAHASLQRQIAMHAAGRHYTALVRGHLMPDEGIIDAPIGRDPHDRKRMATYGSVPRPARTEYRVTESLRGFDLVEATLQTGRTHQIRVHFAAAGHPVAGDTHYAGPEVHGLTRQFLHAHRLRLRSPSSGEELSFSAPLPDDLSSVLRALRWVGG
ncbi:MAG: RluA family pseudouridine synthase [Chloroflexota bacterium]